MGAALRAEDGRRRIPGVARPPHSIHDTTASPTSAVRSEHSSDGHWWQPGPSSSLAPAFVPSEVLAAAVGQTGVRDMIGRMPSDAPPGRGRPSRRTILGAAARVSGAAGIGLLSGCGIRFGGPDPDPRTARPRQRVPDEQVLLTAFHDASRLARGAAALAPATDLTRRLDALHRTQSLVLRDALRRAGVPDQVVTATVPTPGVTPTPGATPTPGGTPAPGSTPSSSASGPSRSSPPTTPAQLAAAEASALTSPALDVLARTTTPHRPTLTAVAACRAAATTALGSTVTWPASDALPAAETLTLLDATRAVAYGFEIVAAHLQGAARAGALTTLQQVRQRESALVTTAGAAAPPEPLGYDLPFPVTTADEARRLATVVLTGLVARGLDPLTTLPMGSRAIGAVVRLQAEAVTLGTPWGVAVTPFPGMTYP